MEEGRRLGETAEAERLLSLARRLLEKGGALESTMSGERIDRTVLAEALERRIEMNAAVGSPLTSKAAAAEALTNAESALNKRAGGALKEKFVGMEEGRRQPVRYPEDVFGISDALLRWHSTILEYFGPPGSSPQQK